jgi:RNase P subunit RPR2
MDNLVFRCTKTGSNVQVRLEESAVPDRDDSYEAVTCLACGRVHLVNKMTGKTLGNKEK